MKKDKLHTITDSDAIEVAKILLNTTSSGLYDFEYEKISRTKYDHMSGCDAEECVTVYFSATVKDESYKASGWNDERVMVQLIEKDAYHDYPYFTGHYIRADQKTWGFKFLSNHIEATEFLQSKQLL